MRGDNAQTSRMLSERSIIWDTSHVLLVVYMIIRNTSGDTHAQYNKIKFLKLIFERSEIKYS